VSLSLKVDDAPLWVATWDYISNKGNALSIAALASRRRASGDHQPKGVGEGSAVRIFNDRGSFEAIAKVSGDVMQGVVVAPLGYWRDSSRGKGTVNALSPGAYADLGRAPTFSDTLVEVAVAEVAAAAE
jgi:predicted molibdopterin-dependent oxidoreductase YjgC